MPAFISSGHFLNNLKNPLFDSIKQAHEATVKRRRVLAAKTWGPSGVGVLLEYPK